MTKKTVLPVRFGTFFITVFILFNVHCSLASAAVTAENKWQGVDESVVEKYAKEYGREAVEPLINTDRGDLLLFVFLLAGTIGGFAAGYYWRVLMEQRSGAGKNRGENKQGDAPIR